jgi:hypothetical protein
MATGIELNCGVLGMPTYEPFAFWGDCSRLATLVGLRPGAIGTHG